jgi:hypothetical protein
MSEMMICPIAEKCTIFYCGSRVEHEKDDGCSCELDCMWGCVDGQPKHVGPCVPAEDDE